MLEKQVVMGFWEGLLNLKNLPFNEIFNEVLFGAWTLIGIKAPPFLLICVILSLLLGLIPLISLGVKTGKIRRSIEKLNREIPKIPKKELPGRQLTASEFDEVSQLFEESIVSNSWHEFNETVVRNDEGKIFNTIQAEEFFCLDKIVSTKLNLALYSSIPSLATSFGLVLTFVAILLGLSKIVISDTGQVDGIAELVSSLSGKFVSSIAALFFALIYTFCQKWWLGNLNSKILRLNSYLNSFFPRQAAESYLKQIQISSNSIDCEIRNLSGDFVSRFSQGFQESAGPVLNKISEVLEGIDGSMKKMNALLERSEKDKAGDMGEMLDSIAQKFQSNLSGSARGEFDRLSDSLDSVSKILEASSTKNDVMINAVAEMVAKMESTSSSHADRSADQLKQNSDQIAKLITQLSEMSQSSASSFAEEMSNTLSKIKATGEIQLQNAREQSESMKDAMRVSFSELSNSLSITVRDLFNGFGISINSIVEDLKQKGESLTEKLDKQGRDVELGYETKVSNVDEKLAILLSGFEATQEQVKEFVRISKSNNDMGISGLREAQSLLDKSAQGFEEMINKSSSVMENFRGFANMVQSASTALEISIKEVISVEKATNSRMLEARRQEDALSSSVKEYTTALESSKHVLATYKQVLSEVDGGLSGLLSEISTGLESYGNAVSRNLSASIREWDNAFSSGYDKLNRSVEELKSSVDDLVEINNTKEIQG